jgi:flagellar motor protein MotB
VQHHKWQFLALAVVVLVAVPWGLRAEEHSLEDSSVQALAEASIAVTDISFNGRDAIVSAPSASTDAIEDALADLTGVRSVAVIDTALPAHVASAGPLPTTPPTVPPQTTTTTTTTLPPSPSLVIEVGNSVRIAGSLPDAITVATLSDVAEFMYGGLVDNELLVDSALREPVWLEAADDVLRTATWLSKGSIELDGDMAVVLGTAPTPELAEAIVAVIQSKLGADVPLTHDVTSEAGASASFEIVAGRDTVEVRGTLPDQRTIQRIASSVAAVREEAEVTNESVLGEGTPSSYLTLRTPYMIRLLGTADEFTYRYEGNDIRGSVVGEAFFAGSDNDTTASLHLLVEALASTLIADPDLVATIEVHSSSEETAAANLELSAKRAHGVLLKLIRAGIDPARVNVAAGDGLGELLRFSLTTAENK